MRFQIELGSSKNDDKITSYCGAKHYPDRRCMGFPFDRPATENFSSIKKFLLKNMLTQEVTIKFDESHDSKA